MMPVIRIPDPVFERLQQIAKPFVDTPATVIERLLDFYEGHPSQSKGGPSISQRAPNADTAVTSLDPYDPPGLRFTRVIGAEVAGEKASNWNELVQVAHRQAHAKSKDIDALRSTTLSKIVIGRKNDSGFHYISDLNLSIQNVDADKAWKNTFHLAKRFNLSITVDVEWPNKDGAEMPGKKGRLTWPPKKG
jgi:hypothetical protein